MADNTNSFIPLWGGLRALVGSPWQLFTQTRRGFSPIGWMFPTLRPIEGRAPVHQRLIMGDIATNGQTWMEVESEDGDAFELPSLGFTGEVDDTEELNPAGNSGTSAPPPKTTWEFGWNPFRLVLRAIPLPVFGFLDIFIQKSKPVVYAVVSLVYQSLPLSNITRISRSVRIVKKSEGYRFASLTHAIERPECPVCGHVGVLMPRRKILGLSSRQQNTWAQGLRCEHVPIDHDNDQIGHNALNELEEITPQTRAHGTLQRYGPLDNKFEEIASLLGVEATRNCNCPLEDHTLYQPEGLPPDPTVDGLFELKGNKVWRYRDKGHGVRCSFCNPNQLHCWDEAIIKGIRELFVAERIRALDGDHVRDFRHLQKTVLLMIARQRQLLRPGERYVLSAVSRSRIEKFNLAVTKGPYVVLTDSDETSEVILKKFPVLRDPENFVFTLAPHRSEISMAGWRLMFAALCPVDCEFLIVNQTLQWVEPVSAKLVSNAGIPWSSFCIANVLPFFMGAALIKGGTSVLNVKEYTYLFYTCGYVYGWDEVIPSLWERLTVLIGSDPGLPEISAPNVPRNLPKLTVVTFRLVSSTGEFRDSYQADFSRENVFFMKALSRGYVDQGRVTIAHAFADPRPITEKTITPDLLEVMWTDISPESPRFSPSSAPGENIISEISHTHGGITFFTFGSRGDRNPVLALAKYIARIGAKVTVIHLNTEEEGKILADMDNEDSEQKIRMFLRAREYLAGFGGKPIIAPQQLLHIGGVSYTLAPPDDIIHPFIASNNVVISALYAALGSFYGPSFRIGAFATPRCLPTSADGENFMKAQLNVSEPGTVRAWWGGSGKPAKGWEHIEQLPPGDHTSMMPHVETMVTNGTVGTVALAALSGCKVIALGSGLDREYRNPYDAGQGFVDGQNPDNIFLALIGVSPAYLGVWLRNNWYNVVQAWAWLGPEGLGAIAFRCLMFYLYASRIHKASFLSTTPMTTLVLMLDGRTSVKFLTFVFYIVVGKVIDTVLKVLGKNYLWLVQQFVSLNNRMITSSIAFWFAQRRGWFAGLLVAGVIKTAEPTFYWLVNWVPITFGAPIDPPLEDDEYAFLEFQWVFSGLPVLHVSLVFEKSGERAEGGFDEFGLYGLKFRKGGFHSPFVFPTKVKRSYVKRKVRFSPFLPYGPTWNCYSVIWAVLTPVSSRMGLGIIPFMVANAVSAILSGGIAVAMALTYTVVTTIPAIGGVSTRSMGFMAHLARAMRNTVDMLEETRGDYTYTLNLWFARLTFLNPWGRWLFKV